MTYCSPSFWEKLYFITYGQNPKLDSQKHFNEIYLDYIIGLYPNHHTSGLISMAKYGRIKEVNVLLKMYKNKYKYRVDFNQTVTIAGLEAGKNGHKEIMNLLMNLRINDEIFFNVYKQVILRLAAENGYLDVFDELLSNLKDEKIGKTVAGLLTNAASYGQINIVTYILEKYGDKLNSDDFQRSKVYASSNGHLEIANLLSSYVE